MKPFSLAILLITTSTLKIQNSLHDKYLDNKENFSSHKSQLKDKQKISLHDEGPSFQTRLSQHNTDLEDKAGHLKANHQMYFIQHKNGLNNLEGAFPHKQSEQEHIFSFYLKEKNEIIYGFIGATILSVLVSAMAIYKKGWQVILFSLITTACILIVPMILFLHKISQQYNNAQVLCQSVSWILTWLIIGYCIIIIGSLAMLSSQGNYYQIFVIMVSGAGLVLSVILKLNSCKDI